MRANERVNTNKFEGTVSRNFTTYNPQVVRDDVFMLGRDGTVKDHRLAVIRSSSAVVVGSQNANREWVYSQEQTVSWEGYSGQAFNPHFPAHDQRRRHDEELHRLPSLRAEGQQRDHGAVARLRHRHGQLLRSLRLRRRGHRAAFTAWSGPSRTSRRRPSAAICKDRLSARFRRIWTMAATRSLRRPITTTASIFSAAMSCRM
jgi:hypothetical protein